MVAYMFGTLHASPILTWPVFNRLQWKGTQLVLRILASRINTIQLLQKFIIIIITSEFE